MALAAVLRTAPDARASLGALNTARQALTGRANAISLEQVLGALDRTLGRAWTLDQAMRPAALAALRRELGKPQYPHTLVQTRPVRPGTPFPQQIVALLPDYALPDSALFQETTNPRVPGRSLPTGLEVAAALGFDAARVSLQANDPQAGAVLAAVGRHVPLAPPADRSIYGGWLRTLATLHQGDSRAPQFMTGDAWQYEKLNTALASWAQTRHNYALYGAQTYVQTLGAESPVPGLVEANPAFYKSLAALASETRETLGGVNALAPADVAPLQALEAQCRAYAADAEAELAGTLTPDRSMAIAGFGDWLEQFQLQTGPLVADVATGMRGEVRHVATGGFNPLIVIPDAKDGTAYVGWTLSYYEFTRPAGDRLTDTRWQQMQASTILRPERPAWAGEFVSQPRGPEWQSREPLRQAESLFQAGRPAEALALLRRTVAGSPDTTLATEAQCRLGQYYEARKDAAGAVAEYLKCRRLPGCDASDVARQSALSLVSDQQWSERQVALPGVRAAGEARTALGSLKAPGLTAAERAAREQRLVAALVRAHSTELLPEAIAACRTPEMREVLRYLLVMVPTGEEEASAAHATVLTALLAFARTAHSPALKAAALCKAVEYGYLAGTPDRLVATLVPYLSLKAIAQDPASVFLAHVLGREQLTDQIDPRHVVEIGTMTIRSQVVPTAYAEGRLEDMVRYERTLPGQEGGHDDADRFMQMYQHYPEFGHRPLSLYARAWSSGNKTPEDAPPLYREVAQEYPESPLAAPALQAAESLLREVHQVGQANEIRALILKNYAETAVGLFDRAQVAFEQDDLNQAAELMDQAVAEDKRHPGEFSEALQYGVGQGLRSQIQQTQNLRRALRPLAVAAGRPAVADVTPANVVGVDPVGLADRFADALPSQAGNVYDALRQLYPSVVPWPAHPVSGTGRSTGCQTMAELIGGDASSFRGRNFGGGFGSAHHAGEPRAGLSLRRPRPTHCSSVPWAEPLFLGEGWRGVVENA